MVAVKVNEKKELVTGKVKTEQRTESGKEELKKEPPVQMVSSIWELLMQSKIHRDAIV